MIVFLKIVFLMFWGLYALDRELVHPSSLDDVIPSWANHMWVRHASWRCCERSIFPSM